MIKSMFACDADFVKYPPKFPLIAEPKIDGVRGCNLNNGLTARTLRPFNNRHATEFFSHSVFRGFDGELAAERENHPLLCSLTTSATNTFEGTPWLQWHIFDYITENTISMPYRTRLQAAAEHISTIQKLSPILGAHLQLIPFVIVKDMAELECIIDEHSDKDYEGTIIRDPGGKYKQGRSTAKEGLLLRIKPYLDVDCIVDAIVEGERNENEATVNRLGHTERSTHAENMVPNGMVGALLCHLAEDAVFNGTVIHKKGDPIRLSAGSMPHDERAFYFKNPHRILQQRVIGRIFPRGVKDKPRHPRYKSFRSDVDTVAR